MEHISNENDANNAGCAPTPSHHNQLICVTEIFLKLFHQEAFGRHTTRRCTKSLFHSGDLACGLGALFAATRLAGRNLREARGSRVTS